MRHFLLVLLAGAACGIGAHVGWFRAHRPCAGGGLDCQLAWMKSELGLTGAQFERIKALHEASAPQLRELAAQVARMKEEYAAFERQRVRSDQVDFVEFARFVETRRSIDRQCIDSTRRLVGATAGIMTDSQRRRYLTLLEPALRPRAPASPD